MLFYIGAFILLLGPLVFVHELGHFIFAKLFNVRVDAFSMGFGPKFLKKRFGETEYCLSAVPLGGYVKLYGQDPSEQIAPNLKHRALANLDPWKRFLVFFAGPLFNFLFAIVVFGAMLIVGEPHLVPVIARVAPGSQAYVAGFRSGDVISSVDRNVVTSFDDIHRIIDEAPNKELDFRIKRNGSFHEIKVVPRPTAGFSLYGESVEVGAIEGLYPVGRSAVIGVSNLGSIAGQAGLRTGDEITAFNGTPVKNFEQLADLVVASKQAGSAQFTFGVFHHSIKDWLSDRRAGKPNANTTEIKVSARNTLEDLGIFSSELFIVQLVPGSPAEKMGLLPGDRLISAAGAKLHSFQHLRDIVQEEGASGGGVELVVERPIENKTSSKTWSITLQPTISETKDAMGQDTKQYMVGIFPLYVEAEPDYFFRRTLNPFTLTAESWSRAIDLSVKTLISIKKLVFRESSMGTLGGPILIGKLAGDSMLRGLAHFLRVMAMISISLAIFNILPVPILDGGHIFLLLVEVVRGRPISMKQTEKVQTIGLSLIVLLLAVVLLNDFTRVGLPALRGLFQ